jgi:hypothetical protein
MNLAMDKRIVAVVGHFGSGKTEFCINYALERAKLFKKSALIDLDIANPYFRSREKRSLLESAGIRVFGSFYQSEITAELPALTANARFPLEDKNYAVTIDVGGDASGSMILILFFKYFIEGDYELLCVINKNRPETSSIEGALSHIYRIEKETGLKITGLINNTHLLRETRVDDIIQGYQFCQELSKELRIPIRFSCCPVLLYEDLCKKDINEAMKDGILPVALHMRETWLDKKP